MSANEHLEEPAQAPYIKAAGDRNMAGASIALQLSLAISAKRIADALDDLADTATIWLKEGVRIQK